MKYNSNYESVQNCTPGTELLHNNVNVNGSSNFGIRVPVDMSVDSTDQLLYAPEFSKSISSLNSDDNKKSVTRKTCTCSSGIGMVPCPSHSGTERSSVINGYSFTQLQQCEQLKINVNTNTNTNKGKTTVRKNKTENGRIKTSNKNVTNKKFDDTLLPSSRTFTIESKNTNTNNCDNLNETDNDRDLSVNSNLDELRLSLTSLISKDANTSDEKHASEAFQIWLAEKKRQEREIRQRESNLQQLIEQERQKKLQMEQENFENWLHAKKRKEKQEKASKKKALQEEQRRKNEKLRREEINKKQYQLWLKLKEEQDLVKKINEQKRKIEKEQREQQRLARNQSAFQEWLISSKDKPKPVPLNRGLESLRTSTSVAFVNPAPWVPNIVEKTKAKSK